MKAEGGIPFHDFGGDGPLWHFAHASAYPPACYRALVEPWLKQARVTAMCQRPLWPGSRPAAMVGWRTFVNDLIDFFEQRGWRGVVGLGHSLGAVATMMAALDRPEMFRAVVLIEPVFLPPGVLAAVAAQPEATEQLPQVQAARRRRDRWPSRQAAFEHLRAKSVFARWPDASLWDFIDGGLVETAAGEVALVFPSAWEARIYSRPPTEVWALLPRLRLPTLAIRGQESDTINDDSWRRWQELQPAATFVEIASAGHMIPMEQPQVLAEAVLAWETTP